MPKYKTKVIITPHARKRIGERLGITDEDEQQRLSHSVLHQVPYPSPENMKHFRTYHYRKVKKYLFVFGEDKSREEFTLITVTPNYKKI